MGDLRTAAQQALEALEHIDSRDNDCDFLLPHECYLKPQDKVFNPVPLYTHPPHRDWQGLTEEEREAAIRWAIDLENTQFSHTVARAIEAALKEKNQ